MRAGGHPPEDGPGRFPAPFPIRALAAALILTAGVVLAAYWPLLTAPGHVSQNWDQTFPPFPDQVRAYGAFSSSTWIAAYEMGSPGVMAGITRHFDFLVRDCLAWLGGSFLARWLTLAFALAGAAGFFVLAARLGLSALPALAVCIVSQFNPRTYSLALNGHIDAAFAYALAPWMLVLADAAVSAPAARRFLGLALCSAMLAALACSSTFGIVTAGPLLFLFALAAIWKRPRRTIGLLAVTGVVVLTLHMNWIAPTVSGAAGEAALKYNLTASDVSAEYVHRYREYSVPPRQAMIGHTDNLGMGTEYAYPVEPPRDQWWKPSAYALLALALLGLLCPVRSKPLKWFAGASLLAGFVLLTGSKTLAGGYLYEVVLARVKMLFFFMARPTRWLPVYYAGLSLLVGLGLEAVRRRSFWRGHRWPDALVLLLAGAALTAYTWPWWSGQLTVPKNETTQTMALTLQAISEEEKLLAGKLAHDPGLYRVTVFPTISSPTGNIPEPPASSLTRNFGMLGKDSLVGPAFIGNPYGRFLLSLAHRRALSTDEYGRLLGLGAVKRVIWDSEIAYLSYLDFGWMPSARRGSETLPDPRGALAPFLAAQSDLAPDPVFSFGSIKTLENMDYLPRLRVVSRARLAAGGYPLLASMAALPDNPFAREALLLAPTVDRESLACLKRPLAGTVTLNGASPELLTPFLPASCWIPARPGGQPVPEGFTRVAERWHHSLWFEGSPLYSGALWSSAGARLAVPLPGAGPVRVFALTAGLPGQHGLDISFGGRTLASTASFDPFDRGWRWIDLGALEAGGGGALTFTARGRGAVVGGVLCVPADMFDQAMRELAGAAPGPATAMSEAEACVTQGGGVYATVRDIPLLARLPGVDMKTDNLRLDAVEGSGAGTLAAEGEEEGVAVFSLEFPRRISRFTLLSWPRLFGDPEGGGYVRAQWSADGREYQSLYGLRAALDGKWEHVYARREEHAASIPAGTTKLFLRFTLRQAQLSSQGNPPNLPMSVAVEPLDPYPGAPSMGQAVYLPARFAPAAPGPGAARARARLLTRDGPRWIDLGVVRPGGDGRTSIALDGPEGAACDLIELTQILDAPLAEGAGPGGQAGLSQAADALAGQSGRGAPELAASRKGPARYEVSGPMPGGGILLFSEAYHPGWRAHIGGESVAAIRAFGAMNAYPLPEGGADAARLEFAAERHRDSGAIIVRTGWIVFALAAAILLLWPAPRRKA
jgi:hypothetical protein